MSGRRASVVDFDIVELLNVSSANISSERYLNLLDVSPDLFTKREAAHFSYCMMCRELFPAYIYLSCLGLPATEQDLPGTIRTWMCDLTEDDRVRLSKQMIKQMKEVIVNSARTSDGHTPRYMHYLHRRDEVKQQMHMASSSHCDCEDAHQRADNVSQHVREEWAHMTDEEKVPFVEMSEKYRQERQDRIDRMPSFMSRCIRQYRSKRRKMYRARREVARGQKRKRDDGGGEEDGGDEDVSSKRQKTYRRRNAFVVFAQQEYERMKKESADEKISYASVLSECGAKWKRMTEGEKEAFRIEV
jgi:hypothetical protein